MRTIVFQSYRTHNVPNWIHRCMHTVEAWARSRGFEYRFVDDRLFDYVPDWFKEKCRPHLCPITDLARLKLARELLQEGFERTVWVDADMLIVAPERLSVDVGSQFAYCHEVWTYADETGQATISHRVNNSISVFVKGNAYLDFFIDACEQTARSLTQMGKLDASTRFLTELHAILPFPILFNVGIVSPALMADIVNGSAHFLPIYAQQLRAPIAAANLCASLQDQAFRGVAMDSRCYEVVIDRCLQSQGMVVNRFFGG
ncbi:MAG: hypothetical protein ACT4NL_15205 [Pseudomarimonas sp.]